MGCRDVVWLDGWIGWSEVLGRGEEGRSDTVHVAVLICVRNGMTMDVPTTVGSS